jgi:hypothetical protein
MGGWPEDEAIISQLEGLGMDTPSGYLYMRPDHQAYKDAVTGFSKNLRNTSFASWDPDGSSPFRSATSRRRSAGQAGHDPQQVDRGGELDQDHLAEGNQGGLLGSRMS